MFAIGCTRHTLHKFCDEILRQFLDPKRILKRLMVMVIGIRHLIHALFDKQCIETYGKTQVLILFTKSRWKVRAKRILVEPFSLTLRTRRKK
jgi:hypothetical protein